MMVQVATPSLIAQSSFRYIEAAGSSKMSFAALGPSIRVAEAFKMSVVIGQIKMIAYLVLASRCRRACH